MRETGNSCDGSNEPIQFCCEFQVENSYESSYCRSPDSLDEALATAAFHFVREISTDNWEDVKQFAALLEDHSALKKNEIAGILGIEPNEEWIWQGSHEAPWKLTHPTLSEDIIIKMWVDDV